MSRGWTWIALPALLALSQPAQAEWGATRWDMSVDEVLAAVGTPAGRVEDERGKRVHDHQRLVTSTIEEDGIAYLVEYYFGQRGRGLTMVRVQPVEKRDCPAQRAATIAQLGPGIDQSSNELPPDFVIELLHWDTGPGTEVREFTDVRVRGVQMACHVLYQSRDFVVN